MFDDLLLRHCLVVIQRAARAVAQARFWDAEIQRSRGRERAPGNAEQHVVQKRAGDLSVASERQGDELERRLRAVAERYRRGARQEVRHADEQEEKVRGAREPVPSAEPRREQTRGVRRDHREHPREVRGGAHRARRQEARHRAGERPAARARAGDVCRCHANKKRFRVRVCVK